MTRLETLRIAIEDFRIFRPSWIHIHSWTPRPLMRLEQCIVCDALREAEEGKYIWL